MNSSYPKLILDYAELLKKFNPTINLLSRKDMDNLMTRHIDDAVLSLLALVNTKGISFEYPIYDLGSGNGIPGVVWAILSPEIKFYLVDTDERKCEFLKITASRLKLGNIEVLNTDFKGISPGDNSRFLCRGLISINSFFAIESVFNELEGYFIKGSTWNTEITPLNPQLFTGLDYKLTDGTERSLVIYKK